MKQLRAGSGLILGLLWVLIKDVATVLVIGKGVEVCET